jgi:signal transduction histidine kinase
MKKKLLIITYFICQISFGQDNNYSSFSKFDSLYKAKNYKAFIQLSKSLKNNLRVNNNFIFRLGKCYDNISKEDSALIYYKKALIGYKEKKIVNKIIETNYAIYIALNNQPNIQTSKNIYFEELLEYLKKDEASNYWKATIYSTLGFDYLKKDNADSSKFYFYKSQYYSTISNNNQLKINSQINLGILQSNLLKNQDSALYYYDNALKTHLNDSINKNKSDLKFYLYNNIGNVYKRKRNFDKALKYFKKAEDIIVTQWNSKVKEVLYNNIKQTYNGLSDFKQAYFYSLKYDSIRKKVNVSDQNSRIKEIEEKYDNEKLRGDKLELENKRKKNRDLFITSLIVLLFGGLTAILFQKNTKRKQLLAEQEKELQIQKVTTLLKEQELTAIDAMIEGQEKERQTIANDLHDDLGGLMATVKLHFDALQKKQSPDLFTKTNNLLDEAYQKIRGIAHAKNSGILASQGLLKAIKNMAKKVSNANNLKIEIIDYGLESRLENSLELTIFRITQELITNVIKHANATEATIQLTNHDHKLNIVVEDNGNGFNIKKLNKASGMGIHSIDKRIENLNGTVVIDSKIGKGTTVIIDIPT